jgi:carbonic anhydrase
MVRSARRNFFALFLGLTLTVLLLPSCSLFQRKEHKEEAKTAAPAEAGMTPEAALSGEPPIQTPAQAEEDARENPSEAKVESLPVPETQAETEAHEAEIRPIWGYSGVIGPDMWSKLDPSFNLCKTGKRQSPIDLRWSKPKKGGDIEFNYKSSRPTLIDNGHTLEVRFPAGSIVNVRGKTYELVQMHFHSGSEHNLSGNSLPMEAHFVHKNEKGELAVIGVIVIEGHANALIQQLWEHWPQKKGQEVDIAGLEFNPESLIPHVHTYYAYDGSLTVPPCTEGVSWNVFNTPLEISKEQLLAFREHYSVNNRPIQPLNGRKVTNY